MVNPELRRQSVEIVEVRVICDNTFEIRGIFLIFFMLGLFYLVRSALLFEIIAVLR